MNKEKVVGIWPLKWLKETLKFPACNLGVPSDDGNGPVRELFSTLNVISCLRLPILSGSFPESWLCPAENHLSETQVPIPSGIFPLIWLNSIAKYCNLVILEEEVCGRRYEDEDEVVVVVVVVVMGS